MKNKLKIFAVILIVIWLFRPIIFRIVDIEFSKIEYAITYRMIWLILFPFAILLVTNFNIKKKKWQLFFKAVIVFISSFIFVSVITFVSMLCEWTFSDTIYKHRTENRRIVSRSLDCGAYSSSDDKYELVEVVEMGTYLYKYYPIDNSKIDTLKWK